MPFGHVPSDLGEALQTPLSVPQRSDNNVGPETGTVLADSPSLILALAALSSFLQDFLWPSTLHIFREIERGNVLPEDFLRPVAFQTLRTIIPTDHAAERIQVEDRVLLDGLHKQTEALLAVAQSLLRVLAIRNILESNAHEIVRQRKNLDRIDTLPDPF